MVMPSEKHFGYSFQWAALALAWLILMISLRIKTQKPIHDLSENSPDILPNT